MSNPGGWVRKQARNQTIKALAYSGGVAGLVVAPFLISLLLPINAGLGVLIGLGCWVGATVLREQARQLWIEAKKANQGSVGEKNVAKLLKPLKRLGWTIEYNIPQRRWGDADVFVRSPRGNYFVIDTKSHKGGVFFDGSVLKRRQGRLVNEFDLGKDLLKAVIGQSHSLKDMKRVSFVQPILCFTQANLENIEPDTAINGVYVVNCAKLVSLLKRLDGN